MSPRAALQLEQMGFEQVYDYVPGKSDWTAAGLPREGESAALPQAADITRREVPTCPFSSNVGEALERMEAGGERVCVVVNEAATVMGLLSANQAREARSDTKVEAVMLQGPATIRANEPLEPLLKRMSDASVHTILVTDPEGRLLGLLDRNDVEEAVHAKHGVSH